MNPVVGRFGFEVARAISGLLLAVLLLGALIDRVDGRSWSAAAWADRAILALPWVSALGAASVALAWRHRGAWRGALAIGISSVQLATGGTFGAIAVVVGATAVHEGVPRSPTPPGQWMCEEAAAERVCWQLGEGHAPAVVRWVHLREGRIVQHGAEAGDKPARSRTMGQVRLVASSETVARLGSGVSSGATEALVGRFVALFGTFVAVMAVHRAGLRGLVLATAWAGASALAVPVVAHGVAYGGWSPWMAWLSWATVCGLFSFAAAGGRPWPKESRG